MTAVQPLRVGIDIAQKHSLQCYTFVCCDCARVQHTATPDMPMGWRLRSVTDEVPLCPDCLPKIADSVSPQDNPRAFSLFLEKQESGNFLVSMQPEQALMRWLPLGFYLTPAEARATADQLLQYAALAERPGTCPDGNGGAE